MNSDQNDSHKVDRRVERETARWQLVAGTACAVFLFYMGLPVSGAVGGGLLIAGGGHLIHYGIVAGIKLKRIRSSNLGPVESAPKYYGRDAVVFGFLMIVLGAFLVMFALGLLFLVP